MLKHIKMKEMVGGCCVCSDERGWAENPLVYCDGHGCNVAVHQACYGIVQVPTGPWFCRKCESQERVARVRCELCPLKDGALKRTDNGGWCHVVCALFIPEAWFANVQTMEPIMLKNVPPDRFNRLCYICEENNRDLSKASCGGCMQCNKNGCKQNFHVTCAQAYGLLCEEAGNYGDNVKYCGYCTYHSKKLKKDAHIKTIPAFKPIPADNATPDSTPEKSYNEPKVNISAEHKNRESLAARRLSNMAGGLSENSRESTPNRTTTRAFKGAPQQTASKQEGEKKNGKGPEEASPAADTKPSTSSSSDNSKFAPLDSGKLFSPLPEGQMTPTVPATTHISFPTSLDGMISSMVNNNNTSTTSTDSENTPGVRQRRSRTSSIEKEKKIRKEKINHKLVKARTSRASVSEDNVDVSPSTTKRQRKKSESIQTPATSAASPAIVTVTSSGGTNSTIGTQNLSTFGGEPHFPNPISRTPFSQNETVVTMPSTIAKQEAQVTRTSPVPPVMSTAPIKTDKVTYGRLVGPPNPFVSSELHNKKPSEAPSSIEELLEIQWELGSNFLMEQGQHFDIASLLNRLHQLKSENQHLQDYVRTLHDRREHLLAVSARLSVPFNSAQAASAVNEGGDGSSTTGQVTPTQTSTQGGDSSDEDPSNESPINVVDTQTGSSSRNSNSPSVSHHSQPASERCSAPDNDTPTGSSSRNSNSPSVSHHSQPASELLRHQLFNSSSSSPSQHLSDQNSASSSHTSSSTKDSARKDKT